MDGATVAADSGLGLFTKQDTLELPRSTVLIPTDAPPKCLEALPYRMELPGVRIIAPCISQTPGRGRFSASILIWTAVPSTMGEFLRRCLMVWASRMARLSTLKDSCGALISMADASPGMRPTVVWTVRFRCRCSAQPVASSEEKL